MKRTLAHETVDLVGKKVIIAGWVKSLRAHSNVTFADIRDRSGIVQVVGDGEFGKIVKEESVVRIEGIVRERGEKYVNPNLATGRVEIGIDQYEILNETNDLPLPLDSDGKEINEDVRLRYRYLDLRRDRMNGILKLRSEYARLLRNGLYARGFTEVETPMLTKATKEGARDFIVPSRHYPGKFYALPQSPQQYKQLLMTAGVERYFQFARCIRDEDLRADRGYEHTQVDLEVSFINQSEIMELIEGLVKESVTSLGFELKNDPFPIIDYKDAIQQYGADKFDLRNEEEKERNVLAFAWVVKFPFFKKVDAADAAEVADGKSGWTFTHNPFSMPIPEHLDWHLRGEHIDEILTTQYDLVCNGYEAGGGSIRAHKPEILRSTFKIMGYSDQEIEENVGHMLEAFSFGTPPHGGIALGIDRHIMIMANEASLKEAIAFPMTASGKTAVMDAPSEVTSAQLKELGISLS